MVVYYKEWQLSAAHPKATSQLKSDKLQSIIVSRLASTLTVIHIVFGTVTLAGTLFISSQDAIAVARFLHLRPCVAILMYEISGMRESIVVESEETSVITGKQD